MTDQKISPQSANDHRPRPIRRWRMLFFWGFIQIVGNVGARYIGPHPKNARVQEQIVIAFGILLMTGVVCVLIYTFVRMRRIKPVDLPEVQIIHAIPRPILPSRESPLWDRQLDQV